MAKLIPDTLNEVCDSTIRQFRESEAAFWEDWARARDRLTESLLQGLGCPKEPVEPQIPTVQPPESTSRETSNG